MRPTKQSAKSATGAHVEGAGPVAECAAIDDRALVRLLINSDELVVAAPGDGKPDAAIRRLQADLERLHRSARERRPESSQPPPDAVARDLTLRRLDVAVRAGRRLLAGEAVRSGPRGPRVTAVVVLVPRKVERCTYRLAA